MMMMTTMMMMMMMTMMMMTTMMLTMMMTTTTMQQQRTHVNNTQLNSFFTFPCFCVNTVVQQRRLISSPVKMTRLMKSSSPVLSQSQISMSSCASSE